MAIDLPAPIADYMAAKARLDAEAILAPFAADAVVFDEKRIHRGRAEIGSWIETATIGNKAVPAPLSYEEKNGTHAVTAEVSGDFAGSPVTLVYRFRLVDGRIAALGIS